MKVFLSVILAVPLILLIFFVLQPITPDKTTQTRTTLEWHCNGHVAYGVPGEEDQLLCRDGYAVGYNYEQKAPSWVAYHITKDSVAIKHERSNKFVEDKEIPEVYRSTLSDYKGSGYDRGHMAPAATIDYSETSMQESFLLSNMTPQLPGLNRQGWRHLEEYVRDWAEERGDLYVVTGALYESEVTTIGNLVSVPSSFYKVIYAPAQSDGIAFMVPHRDISKTEITSFIVSIDYVEERSGLDFISLLPDDIENNIEDDVELFW